MAASRSACSRRLLCLASGLHTNLTSSPQCPCLNLLVLGCKGYCSESYTAHTNFASFPQFLHLLHGCMVADAIAQSLIQLKAANTGTNGSIGLALFGVCPTQRCRQSASQQVSMFTRLVYMHLHQKTANTTGSKACAYAQQPLAEMHVAVPVIKHLSC